jgi:hypothetical protein
MSEIRKNTDKESIKIKKSSMKKRKPVVLQ